MKREVLRPSKRPKDNGDEVSNRSRQEHAMHCRAAMRKTVEGILELGSALIEAKQELPQGEYEAMVVEDLGMSLSMASKFRLIASHPVLRSHVNALPPCMSTLYELSMIKPEALQTLIEDGTVNPKLERSQAEMMKAGFIVFVPSRSTKKNNKQHFFHCALCDQENASGSDRSIVPIPMTDDLRQLAERVANEISDILIAYPVYKYPKAIRKPGRRWTNAIEPRRSAIRQRISRLLASRERLPEELCETLAHALRSLADEANELANTFLPNGKPARTRKFVPTSHDQSHAYIPREEDAE